MSRVLVLLTDGDDRRSLQCALAEVAEQVDVTDDLATARAPGDADLLLCDAARVADLGPGLMARAPVVALASRDRVDLAMAAMEAGARDALLLPAGKGDLALCIRRVSPYRATRPARPKRRPTTEEGTVGFAGMVGASQPMQEVFRTIEKVAGHKANVLITGESGTGKELVARAIHKLGRRSSQPFVAVNCGAIPATLLESELFGYVRGAFTDAVRDKPGLFEQADGGTLFLDEIGELSPALQVKLLRVLQEEEVRRIGSNTSFHVDVRVISATLRNLDRAIEIGAFREDLYYRLNVLPIHLPPLRDRPEDIPPLVEHFLERYRRKHATAGPAVEAVSAEAMELMCSYAWPGNIRELENAMERVMVLCEGAVIEPVMLEPRLRSDSPAPAVPGSLADALPDGELSIKKTTRRLEQELIRRALEATDGNRTNAAKLLEISHRALLYKIKEYGL